MYENSVPDVEFSEFVPIFSDRRLVPSSAAVGGSVSDFVIVDPNEALRRPEVAEAVHSCGVFASPAWFSVLQQSYGYRPGYLVGRKRGGVPALVLPFMEVRSLLTGSRGISVPFSDYCPLFAASEEDLHKGIAFLKEYGRKRGWRYLELRPDTPEGEFDSESAFGRFYVHTLDLLPSEDELLSTFSTNTRRNIRKAGKTGLSTRVGTDLSDVLEFYGLHVQTRRHHGLPPQPVDFFVNLHRKIIGRGKGMVVLAHDRGTPVAGNVYLGTGQRAWYKYGALDRNHTAARASFLVMWEAIRAYKRAGATSLCMGRTDLAGEGLTRFKDGWGTTRKIINYVRYDYAAGRFVSGRNFGPGAANPLFRRLPLGLLRLAGKYLYRHVA